MINRVRLDNTSIISQLHIFFLVVRTFKMYSLCYFQIFNTVTMLHIPPPKLTHLITRTLYCLSICPHFSNSGFVYFFIASNVEHLIKIKSLFKIKIKHVPIGEQIQIWKFCYINSVYHFLVFLVVAI